MATTYDLSIDELANLLVDNIRTDVYEVNTEDKYVSLHSSETMTHAFAWTQPHEIVGFTIHLYERLMKEAAPSGYTPLFIVATPEGIYEFDMNIIEPQFESYSDGEKPDVLVADIPLSKGKRILEFYPEFSNEEEYLDARMGDAEPSQWDEGDEW